MTLNPRAQRRRLARSKNGLFYKSPFLSERPKTPYPYIFKPEKRAPDRRAQTIWFRISGTGRRSLTGQLFRRQTSGLRVVAGGRGGRAVTAFAQPGLGGNAPITPGFGGTSNETSLKGKLGRYVQTRCLEPGRGASGARPSIHPLTQDLRGLIASKSDISFFLGGS